MVSAKIKVVSREKRATAQASTVTAVLRSTKAIANSELTSQPQPIVTGATTALGKIEPAGENSKQRQRIDDVVRRQPLSQITGENGEAQAYSQAVRQDIEQRGGKAVIPSLASRKIQHAVDKAVYALRNRIERFFNRAKNSRRVATRYVSLRRGPSGAKRHEVGLIAHEWRDDRVHF